MNFEIKIEPRLFHFKRPAGTSRGVYTTRQSWYILFIDKLNPNHIGYGECAPLHDLSCDFSPNYESLLHQFVDRFNTIGEIDWQSLYNYPSILFGFETALQHYTSGSLQLWNTPFSRGEAGIPINGLIWMGSFEQMEEQIKMKMSQGYRCIKLKIGAIDFEKEMELIAYIRKCFSAEEVELRVDANGAFSVSDALDKLKRLANFNLHSIEQPIRAGQELEMAKLTKETPLPIALDEELIGHNTLAEKRNLLDTIHPQYIILKPSLHGGIKGCSEWIDEAESRGIGWWITSALESNIGLNAIAQWTATLSPKLPQGLGTGMLFTDNVELPLEIRQDALWFNPQKLENCNL